MCISSAVRIRSISRGEFGLAWCGEAERGVALIANRQG
jgi:hypothetical protein